MAQGATASGPGPAGPGPTGPGPRRRGTQTLGDLVRSLALLLVVVVVIALVTFRPKGQEIQVVDYRATLAGARVGAPFPLLAPDGLGGSWRATSAYFDPPVVPGSRGATWHIGFVTPDNQYAGFEQTDGSAADVLRQVLASPQPEGTTTVVAGQPWARWDDGSGHRALVRTTGGTAVVVDGSAGWPELEQLAAALRTSG
jgi:hypothetical protein